MGLIGDFFEQSKWRYEHNPFVGDRPMKYPYTIAAKIAQYPYVFHYRYSLVGRAMVLSYFACLPVMYYIQKISYSPGNVEEWKEIRRKWYEPHHVPEWDLY